MKNLFSLLLIAMIWCSCNKESVGSKNQITENEIRHKDSSEQLATKPENKAVETPRDQVRHFFSANGGSILYLKNGEVKGQARFDTDGDFITDLMKTKIYATYREFDNYLTESNGGTTPFFEDVGQIDASWKILKGETVENPMQVFSYHSPKNPKPENVETITETTLIIFNPETKTFADEHSEEAEHYFIAMDDWNWYSHELSENFEKMGIKTIYLKKPNLKLKIGKNREIIINTKQKINNYNPQALLYVKGKRPLIVHLIASENRWDEIKTYLK